MTPSANERLEKLAAVIHKNPQRLRDALDSLNPDDLVQAFKRQVDHHWWIDPTVSVEYADLIVQTGQLTGDSRRIALGKMAKGDSKKLLGQSADAWHLLDEAGALFLEADDKHGWARTCIGRLALAAQMNRLQTALESADAAEAVFREQDDWHMLVRLFLNRAMLYDHSGDHQQSLAYTRQAEAAALQLGDAGEMYFGGVYMNMGIAQTWLGDLPAAREAYIKVFDHYQSRGEPGATAIAQVNLAYVERLEGNYREALRLLHAAQPHLQERLEYAHSLVDMTQCYLSLNRYEEALDIARKTVTLCAESDLHHEEARTRCYEATALVYLNQPDNALETLARAEDFYRSTDAAGWQGIVHLQRSRIALQMHDYELACTESQQAVTCFQQSQRRINETEARIQRSNALLHNGNFDDARQVAERSLAAADEQYLLDATYLARTILGKIAEHQQQPDAARQHYRAALDIIDTMQRNLTMTLRTDYMADKNEATTALIRLALTDDNVADAFMTLERAKSQALMDYLVNRETFQQQSDDSTDSQVTELKALRNEHHMLYHLLYEPRRDDAPALEIDPDTAIPKIKQLETRIQTLIEQRHLSKSAADIESRAAVRPSLDELQARLDAKTCLVEYIHDGRTWSAFVLSAQNLTCHPLPLSVSKTDDLIDSLQFNIDCALSVGVEGSQRLAQVNQRMMKTLYDGLFAPLQDVLANMSDAPDAPDAIEQLIIVPYGMLHYLPFNLLYTGDDYLVDCYEIAIYPQAGLLMQAAPQRSGGMRLLAHSLDGTLPGVLQEADLLMDIVPVEAYTDDSATRDQLDQEPLQVLHLGTHGEHRLDQPDLSYIRLANSQVYTDDLLQHDLSYELVTLSACETGVPVWGQGMS